MLGRSPMLYSVECSARLVWSVQTERAEMATGLPRRVTAPVERLGSPLVPGESGHTLA